MKKIVFGVVALVAAYLGLSFFLRPVAKVAVVTAGLARQAVPGSVQVSARYQMEVKSDAGGRVIESNLELGDRYPPKAKLLQIDPTDLQIEIERLDDEYQAAKKKITLSSATRLELDLARENLENYERLTKSGNFAPAEFDRQRRAVKQIEQKLALEEVANDQTLASYVNGLKVKRRQLEKMTITAPFDGVISAIYAWPGDLISPGAPVAQLISTGRTVEARISEENFAGVQVGQRATVRFLGYGSRLYPATVTKILPTADPETQRYVVHLNVEIDPNKLVPGITGEVTIIVGERQAQATIPRRALLGNNVYVVNGGRVQLRKVEVGYVSLTMVEIVQGLRAGEQVIVEEQDIFHDGQRVRTEVVPAL